MTLENHIPFGLKIEDNTFIDVAEVPKGKQCGCICPSCHIRLVARQGNVNRWHFAHSCRKVDTVDQECEFSFFVSVRAMAKQLIDTRLLITLPEWHDRLIERRHGIVFSEDYCITSSNDIHFDNIQKEYSFENTLVDIYGNIDKYPFLIYFTHPGRNLPENLLTPKLEQCGILEIKLDNTSQLFSKKDTANIKFIDELKDFLQHDNDSKQWIFHPRKNSKARIAQNKLDERIANNINPSSHNPEKRKQNEQGYFPNQESGRTYQCLNCQSTWIGRDYRKLKCPKCHRDHLYIRNIFNKKIL